MTLPSHTRVYSETVGSLSIVLSVSRFQIHVQWFHLVILAYLYQNVWIQMYTIRVYGVY